MPIDSNIGLSFKPVQIQNPLEQYAQVQQIQAAQNHNRLADLMYGEKQREIDQSNALADVYKNALGSNGVLDRTKLYESAAQRGLGEKIPALQKGFADTDKSNYEATLKRLELAGQVAGTAKDQGSYERAVQQLRTMGMDMSAAPAAYDPQIVSQFQSMAISAKDQVEQALKAKKFALDNANEAFSLDANGKAVPNNAYQAYQLNKAKAGATNVSVNTEKGFLGEVAKGVGNSVETSMNAAKAAVGTINNVNQIRSALDSGKIITGPGADTKIMLKQLGVSLGLGGKDDAETLANTRALMQAMAGQELSAAEAMKGQGAITENERSLIKRAASGDVSMTAPEINALTQAIEKTARFRIRSHADNVKRLGSNPNAAPIVDFMRVEEPPAYSSPKTTGAGFKYLGKE